MTTKKNLCILLIALSSAVLAQPVLQWGNGIGSTGIDGANDMIVDGSGNHIVTGYFSGTVDFDPSAGLGDTFNLTSSGGTDIFIAKYDVNGNFLWAKGMGGSLNEAAQAVFMRSDSIYITGSFEGTVDFDPGAGFLNRTSNGGTDIFLAKYDNTGNLVWAKGFGGPGNDIGRDLGITWSSELIVAGSFENTVDFDPESGIDSKTSNGLKDIFYSKFDLSGNFIWSRAIGGPGNDEANGLIIPPLGLPSRVRITGYFSGTVDFNANTTSVANKTSNGGTDIFVTDFATISGYFVSVGTPIITFGGTDNDTGWDITYSTKEVASGGGIVYSVVGEFENTVDFGVGTKTSAGGKDAFLLKLGTWVKTMGGTDDDAAKSISRDLAMQLYISGKFKSPTLNVDQGATNYSLTNSGGAGDDVFFGKYTPDGDLICAGAIGSPTFNDDEGAITNFKGEFTVAGKFGNTADFDPSVGNSNIVSNGSEDMFISKYSSCQNCFPLTPRGKFVGMEIPNVGNIDTSYGDCTTTTICVSIDTINVVGTGPFAYEWSWDDGSPDDFSAVNSFCHTYTVIPGQTYYPSVLLTDSCGNSERFGLPEFMKGTFPSGACFTYPSGACVNEDVNFVSMCSGTCNPGIWDFGDGSPLYSPDNCFTSHVFISPGSYNVTLYSQDMCQFVSHIITIYTPPTADFSYAIGACPGTPLSATDLSIPGSNAINTWQWDFDYNGDIESTLQNPSYTYPAVGTYAIRLYVSDTKGCFDDTVITPVVIGDAAIADFNFNVGCPCNSITFSSTGGATSWLWDFGDGTTSTLAIPEHSFLSPGSYWVTLNATNAGGCKGRKKILLDVCQPDMPASTSKSNNNWCLHGYVLDGSYGQGGLDFNNTPPTLITGNSNSGFTIPAYPATMSNAKTGALQFFVINGNFYNANFQASPGVGWGLENVIVPFPGNFNKYYIFNRGGPSFGIVDMTLNGGLGGVAVGGNIPSFPGQLLSSFTPNNDLSATERKPPIGCNDAEYWMIIRNSTTSYNIYLIKNTGITLNSTQTIGATFTQVANQNSSNSLFSKSGNKYIFTTATYTEIYDFNKATGVLSNPIHISGVGGYAFAISPNDRYLYCGVGNKIKQYDLLSTAVPPAYIIIPAFVSSQGLGGGAMDLGPDDKIYISEGWGTTTLGVINNPDNPGLACNYVPSGITARIYGNDWTMNGLQNIVPLNLPVIDTSFAAFSVNTNSCLDVSFTNMVIPPYTDTCSWLYNNDQLVYTWNFGDGSPEVITSDTSQIIHTYAFGSNTYIVSLIVDRPFMCTSDTLFQTIAVDSLPTAGITGITTICSGNSTTLTASGGDTYSWSTGETTTAITVSPTSTTTYTVTASNGSCTGATTVVVTVNQNPIISVSPSAICAGGTSTLTATGGTDYLWSTAATTSAITVSPTITTSYSLTATTAGCSTTASATVIVGSTLVPVITGDTTICNGSSTILTTAGGTDYLWSTTETTSAITVFPTTTTSYTVMVTGGSCTGTVSQTVTVNPNPTPGITGTTTICNGSSTIFTATGGGSYSWSTNETTTAITVSPTSNTTYTVVAISNAGCTGATTISVTVNPIPTPSITGAITICIGSSTILTATGGGTYNWSTNETTTAITVSPTNTTTYTVTADNSGCTGSTTIVVSIVTPPIAIATGATVCEGETINLTSTGGVTYSWNGPNAFTSTLQNPIITNSTTLNSGTYTVTVSNGSCSDTTTALVTVNPTPSTNAGSDVTITPGSSTTLTATGGTTYIWTPTTGLDCGTCASVIATPTATTVYCVQTSIGTCNSTDCITVTVEAPCPNNKDLAVPNAFSPNADGHNDDFCLQGWNNCIETFTIFIYDRWGEKVFESEEANFCWDGMFRGKIMDSAVFVYYIKATFTNDEKVVKKGNVSLIK